MTLSLCHIIEVDTEKALLDALLLELLGKITRTGYHPYWPPASGFGAKLDS